MIRSRKKKFSLAYYPETKCHSFMRDEEDGETLRIMKLSTKLKTEKMRILKKIFYNTK